MVVSGCGSSKPAKNPSKPSTSSATSLLHAAFTGKHTLNSGDLQLSLEIVPTGSTELTTPVTIAFGGPFQTEGSGKVPKSDFTVSGELEGHSGKLQIISTGTAGYITVDGTSYQLPAASFRKLESGLGSVSGTGSTKGGKASTETSLLSSLGIQPLKWLNDPRVVGQQTVSGTATTHVSAKVDVAGLLKDMNTLIANASKLGVPDAGKVKSEITPAEQAKIAAAVKSPSFDVWIGNSDKTLRKLTIAVTVPVSGELRTLLSGLSSVHVTLTVQYSDLNQPQTITAPTNVQPYKQFQERVAALLEEIEGGIASSELGSTGVGTSTTGATTTTGGLSGVDQKYSQCITQADGNVSKMQKCSSLLTGGN